MSNVGKTFELREFVAMLKSNLKSEELLYLEKEFHDEVVQRASAIVVLIPGIENIFYLQFFVAFSFVPFLILITCMILMLIDEVWMTVFDMRLRHDINISKVLPFKQVCKRWNQIFPNSFAEINIFEMEQPTESIFDA